MQNLCGLRVYIKFIFWSPQQQWSGKSHGATGILSMESVHQYLHWRKISEETIRDNYLPLSIAICPFLSFPARLTEVSVCPFVCVCLSIFCPVCLLICPHIYVLVVGEYAVKKNIISVKTWPIIRTTVRRRPIVSWIWPQLIAAVVDLDSLLPPGFQLFGHQAVSPG